MPHVGVRVVSLTKSRKMPTRNTSPPFFVCRKTIVLRFVNAGDAAVTVTTNLKSRAAAACGRPLTDMPATVSERDGGIGPKHYY